MMMFSCSLQQEDRARVENRNLNNNTSTFIFNMIPENGSAIISDEYTRAINTFSVKLLDLIYTDSAYSGNNLVLSPFSVSRNLAVLAEGTTGESQRQLLEALGGNTALDDAKDALSQLLYADKSVVLQCADIIWVNPTYSLRPSFREKINRKYGVEVAALDFSNASVAATTINRWIRTNTNNFINQIIDQSDISSMTAAVWADAIYFEADWKSPFDVTKTAKADFQTSSGAVKVDMMSSNYYFKICKTATYENAKLYYGSSGKDYFYLDVYMPTAVTMQSFIANECLDGLNSQDSTSRGHLKIPRFFFETEVNLIPALQKLGVRGVFDQTKGEITEMIDGSADGLFISMVRHKAGIRTDEEGTKAYAATVSKGNGIAPNPSPDVVLNRPFAYFIRAGKNGLVLFAGVVNNPH